VVRLSDSERANLDFGQDKLDILDDLQQTTAQARDRCIKQRWRFSRPGKNGETIVLRDLFRKIATWIDMFVNVGDAATQYDPVHTALPWAGVRFLLKVVAILVIQASS